MARIRFSGCLLVFAVVFFPEMAQAAGFFAVLASQENPVTLTITPNSAVVGSTATAVGGGGSGNGTITYATTTSALCSVNAVSGVIQASAVGSCSIIATRGAADNYASRSSQPAALTIYSPVTAPVIEDQAVANAAAAARAASDAAAARAVAEAKALADAKAAAEAAAANAAAAKLAGDAAAAQAAANAAAAKAAAEVEIANRAAQ